MGVIITESHSMNSQLLNDLKKLLPQINIVSGKTFFWSPETRSITYNNKLLNNDNGKWALLHEVAHADLDHKSYNSDIGLLKLEVEAWEKAKQIGSKYNISINEDHIQDCLDTYRDWLHSRSKCPECEITCLQSTTTRYSCHNCNSSWSVSDSKLCRPYRLKINILQEKKSQPKVTTFS